MAIDLSKKLMAEFVAMALFVFVGCGTAVSSQVSDPKEMRNLRTLPTQRHDVCLVFRVGD